VYLFPRRSAAAVRRANFFVTNRDAESLHVHASTGAHAIKGSQLMKPRIELNREIHVQFKPEVTKEQVIAAVEEMFRISGCVSCGLRGIDLRLLGGDPELQIAKLGTLAGIAGAFAE
jgi:hypothetical protein